MGPRIAKPDSRRRKLRLAVAEPVLAGADHEDSFLREFAGFRGAMK